jgi:hypothetical protein
MAELTKRQKTALSKHAKHHTAKHMTAMRKDMRAGKTFTQAHKNATKKVARVAAPRNKITGADFKKLRNKNGTKKKVS